MYRFSVKYVNPPKVGKKMGNIRSADKVQLFFDPQKFTFTTGDYDLETEEKTWGDSTVYVVTKAQPAEGGNRSAAGGSGTANSGLAPFWLPCVSNVLAHAIQAGQIERPEQLANWARAARDAILNLDKPVTDVGVPPPVIDDEPDL